MSDNNALPRLSHTPDKLVLLSEEFSPLFVDFNSTTVQNRILYQFNELFEVELSKMRYRYLYGLVELTRAKRLDFKQLNLVI